MLALHFILLILINVAAESQVLVGKNVHYSNNAILKQIDGISHLQCAHRCSRHGDCKHVGYDSKVKTCLLLNGVEAKPSVDDIWKDEIK